MDRCRIGILGLSEGIRWVQSVTKRADSELTVVFDPSREKTDKILAGFKTRAHRQTGKGGFHPVI